MMLSWSASVPIYLCVGAIDMRKGFDGLSQVASHQVEKNVLDGGLFVFVNRRRDRVKLLWWDEDGLALFYKRLERGTFEMPKIEPDTTSVTLSGTQLRLILSGIELCSVRHRTRYSRVAKKVS